MLCAYAFKYEGEKHTCFQRPVPVFGYARCSTRIVSAQREGFLWSWYVQRAERRKLEKHEMNRHWSNFWFLFLFYTFLNMVKMMRRCCGLSLLICSVLFLIIIVYTTVISKLLPPPESPILELIRSDRYYCLLIPLTIPVFVFAVYLNWFSINLYKSSWYNLQNMNWTC